MPLHSHAFAPIGAGFAEAMLALKPVRKVPAEQVAVQVTPPDHEHVTVVTDKTPPLGAASENVQPQLNLG